MERLEYITKRAWEGALLLKRAALISGYILLLLSLIAITFVYCPHVLMIPFLLLDAAVCALAVFLTKWYFCIEDELIFFSGEMTLTAIYGRSIRKKKLSLTLNSLIEVGVYDDEAYERLSNMSLQRNFFSVSSMSAETVYYAIFDQEKDRCVLYFEADERAIRLIKQNNFSAVKSDVVK